MWGAPDNFTEKDSMWGVYKFKRGFGGIVVRTIGAWDFAVNPFLYKIYSQVLPRVLSLMRRSGKSRTQRSVEPLI
jgi:lipid II:glycine glycyltransferase (peptidoglycan interpeptide bridge formation enzyme)